MNEYCVTVDIAKKRDYTAIMIVRDNPEIVPGSQTLETPDRALHYYDIVFIDKFQGVPYGEIADRVAALMRSRELAHNADLLVDGTGVGEAAIDAMREVSLYPVPIVFTGGDRVNEVYASAGEVFRGVGTKLAGARVLKQINVPKQDLVVAGSLLLQQNRIRVAKGLRWGDDFKHQLSAFRGKVNEKTRAVKYEAETEADHDDLVVTFLMAAWWLGRQKQTVPERQIHVGADDAADWNPFDFM